MCDYGAPLHRDVNTRKLMQSTRDALVDAKKRGTLSRKNLTRRKSFALSSKYS